MLREVCHKCPHVAEARIAIPCWQPLSTWDPLPGAWGTALVVKWHPDPWLGPSPSIRAPQPYYHRPVHKAPDLLLPSSR